MLTSQARKGFNLFYIGEKCTHFTADKCVSSYNEVSPNLSYYNQSLAVLETLDLVENIFSTFLSFRAK